MMGLIESVFHDVAAQTAIVVAALFAIAIILAFTPLIRRLMNE